MPKSTTLTPPSSVIITLAGLTSRCTRPAACATSSASHIAAAIPTARSIGSGPCSASTEASDRPRISSITMYGEPSSMPESKTMAIRGCTSIAACWASRPNRSANLGSSASALLSTLTATGRPSTRSMPWYTVAMPPTPRIPTSS